MAKSYKQLYEELKAQKSSFTEEELFALEAVAYGCNTNKKLFRGAFLNAKTNKTVSFEDALVTVYKLIERLKEENNG